MLPVIRYRYRVGTLLFLLVVITYLDRVCISFAGPRIQEYLQIGPQQWGWVVGVFAISYGAFEIPGGWMADRFGPRIILARIVLWWSLFTVLTGTVSSYPALLLTRFWFGAGEAGAFPNATASIAAWFPANEEDAPSVLYRLLCRSEEHLARSWLYQSNYATVGVHRFTFLLSSVWRGRLSGFGGSATRHTKSTVSRYRN